MIYKKYGKIFLLLLIFTALFFSFAQTSHAVKKEFTLAAVGDCIITQKISMLKDPQFVKLANLLQGADVVYGNCETSICKPGDFFPAWKTTDPNVYCEPWGADELKWMGFDIMSLANNHSLDFSFQGLFETISNLERVGIAYAGAGKDLGHASKPGYADTVAGVVSLVSCSSWIPEKNFQASAAHPHMKGRPGLNPINAQFALEVNEKTFTDLKNVRLEIIKDLGLPIPEEKKELKQLNFGSDTTFYKGEKTKFLLKADPKDQERVVASVKNAANNSRIVIVSMHEHIGDKNQTAPTKMEEDFARRCIDAGADLFVGTGSHALWGVEIYKGKPIFYSLGNFFFQEVRIISAEAYGKVDLPADTTDPYLFNSKFDDYFKDKVFWESVVPIITFNEEGKVKQIKLYPIELGQDDPIYQRGLPSLADKERAESILKRLAESSKDYKTEFSIKKGVGEILIK